MYSDRSASEDQGTRDHWNCPITLMPGRRKTGSSTKQAVEAFKQQSIKSYCTGTAVLHEDGRGLIQHATNILQVQCNEE